MPTSYLSLLNLNRGLDSQNWSLNFSKTRDGNTTGYPLQERLLKWRLRRGWGRWASRSCGGAASQLAEQLAEKYPLRMCVSLQTGGKNWEEYWKDSISAYFVWSLGQFTNSQWLKHLIPERWPSVTSVQDARLRHIFSLSSVLTLSSLPLV